MGDNGARRTSAGISRHGKFSQHYHAGMRPATGCEVRPVSTMLKGFGGGTVHGVGEVTLIVTVDDVSLDITAVVTILMVRDGKAMLSCPDELIQAISLEEGDVARERFCMRLEHDVIIALGTASEVAIQVEDAHPGKSVFVQAQKHEDKSAVVAIPNTTLEVGAEVGSTTLAILNYGTQSLVWRAGRVVARARRCNSGADLIRRVGVNDFDPSGNILDLLRLDIGDISEDDRMLLISLIEKWYVFHRVRLI